jgi:hypothetical protein
MQDKLDFIITLRLNRFDKSIVNHTYTVLLDDQVIETNTLTNDRFTGELLVTFSKALDFGPHTLNVTYTNTLGKGNLRVENVYVGGSSGSGTNCDSLLPVNPVIRSNETYSFTFNSPFFYWALSKFPI